MSVTNMDAKRFSPISALQGIASRIFSMERESGPADLWWTIGIAAVLGILYGVFVHPLWSESVEFGQAWAGLIDYEYSHWGVIIFSEPSLQIIVPALLLLAGFHVWTLSVIATAFFCATSFSSVAAACFAFSKNIAVSVACSLLLLSYAFGNPHGYPVEYPVSFFQFGQTGQYLALLGLSLAACDWPIAAGLVGGSLAGVHAVWALVFATGAFPIIARKRPKSLKRLTLAFVVSSVGASAFLYLGGALLPPKPIYKPPPSAPSVTQESPNPAGPHSGQVGQRDNGLDLKSNSGSGQSLPAKPLRGTFTGHNILFADASSPLKAAAIFFLPEFVFLLLILAFRFAQRPPRTRSIDIQDAELLLASVAVPVSLAIVFKLYEEIDPDFYIFGVIYRDLPPLIIRAIFNRWLNLTELVIPAMAIGILTILIRNKKSWLASATFGIAVLITAFSPFWLYVLYGELGSAVLGYCISVIVPFLLLLTIYSIIYKKLRPGFLAHGPSLVIGVILTYMFTVKLTDLGRQAYVERRFTGSDAVDKLAEVARADQGGILISPGVVSARGFSPQLRTGRPVELPYRVDVYDSVSKNTIHVFCYSDDSIPFAQFYTYVRPCFESRPVSEWAAIRRGTHSTGLITPADWKLEISPAVTGGGFSYYRLPN